MPLESQPLAPQGSDRDLAVSPDGQRIVYRAAVGNGFKLVVRDLTQAGDRVLDGTDFARSPFISSDGQWVGFFEGAVLRKVPLSGGSQSTLATLGANPRGAAWRGDTIIVATADPATGLLSVPASGGTATVITKPDNTLGEGDHVAPSFLPDSDRVLFSVVRGAAEPDIALLDLKTGQRKTILRGGRMPQYIAPGILMLAGPGLLKAARFDLARGEVVSEAVPVVESVSTPSNYAANYDVSQNGMLVYIPGVDGDGTGAQRSLVWVNPDGGREEALRLDARAFVDPRIGIDDRQVVVELNDAPDDVWTVDVARGALTRQTFEEGEDETPAWMPDGKTLVYASTRTGVSRAVFSRRADGAGGEEQLWSGSEHVHIETPTPDGKSLILSAATSNGAQTDLLLLPLEGKREWQPLLQTRFNEFGARLSPDGRWMAYSSDESGRLEVYVRAFPTLDNKVQVSTTGGQEPIWSKRGDALYFRTGQAVMAASVKVQGNALTVALSRKLFENKYHLKGGNHTGYDVAHDGRFLMVKAGSVMEGAVPVRSILNVVLNWPEELKSRIK